MPQHEVDALVDKFLQNGGQTRKFLANTSIQKCKFLELQHGRQGKAGAPRTGILVEDASPDLGADQIKPKFVIDAGTVDVGALKPGRLYFFTCRFRPEAAFEKTKIPVRYSLAGEPVAAAVIPLKWGRPVKKQPSP